MKPSSSSPTSNSVLVLDFGSQVTQLIARRARELGIFSEIVPFNVSEERLRELNPRAVILSGGPASVKQPISPRAPQQVFELGVPVLGICYGQQTMVAQLGGEVINGLTHEYGHTVLDLRDGNALLENPKVWMSHGDQVVRLPEGFATLASSPGAPHAMIADESRRFYAVQFHPEVSHTPGGKELLRRFLVDIAGCEPDYHVEDEVPSMIKAIRRQVGNGRVICGLSGGVDSAVTAVLLHEAIGDQLVCIHVDHGLNRKGESDQVVEMFRGSYNIPLHRVDAGPLFLGKLEGVTDPERKRKISAPRLLRCLTRRPRSTVRPTFWPRARCIRM